MSNKSAFIRTTVSVDIAIKKSRQYTIVLKLFSLCSFVCFVKDSFRSVSCVRFLPLSALWPILLTGVLVGIPLSSYVASRIIYYSRQN